MSNDNPYGINKDTPKGPESVPAPNSGTVPPNSIPSPAEGAPSAPQGQYPVPPQAQANYPIPPQGGNPQGTYPVPPAQYAVAQVQQKPRDLSVAYAFLYFLGIFGGHKFYLGQMTQGFTYLGIWIAGAFLSIFGIGFLVFVGMAIVIYGDIRTMQEQLVRSENGEQFSPNIFQFMGRAFS